MRQTATVSCRALKKTPAPLIIPIAKSRIYQRRVARRFRTERNSAWVSDPIMGPFLTTCTGRHFTLSDGLDVMMG